MFTVSAATFCFAVDLGKVGQTYPIVETDPRDDMKALAAKIDKEKIRKGYEKEIVSFKPNDLVSLPRATEGKKRLVDMTYTLEFDITGADGTVYPKGFTFNPLDYVDYYLTLIIVNGDDRAQVEWLKSSKYAKDIMTRVYLTDGSYYNISKELSRNVYYARKKTIDRFQIERVPSVVVQKGKMMEVTEIDIESAQKKTP